MTMKLAAVMWNSYVTLLAEACAGLPWVEASLYGARDLDNDPALLAQAVEKCREANVILLHRSSEPFWESLEREIGRLEPKKPCICLSYDPAFWTQSSVPLPLVQQCYNSFILGGRENMAAMLTLIGRDVMGLPLAPAPLVELPWEGLYHPAAERAFFPDVAAYLEWYAGYARDKGLGGSAGHSSGPHGGPDGQAGDAPLVAVLLSRFYWVNRQLAIEDAIIAELEGQGLRVLPIFSHGVRDVGLGSKGPLAFLEECLLAGDSPNIAALVKLTMFFLGRSGGTATEGHNAKDGVALFTRLNVPVFQPAISSSMSPEQWEQNPQGLGLDVSWTVAMPEFEGVIEPLYAGGPRRTETAGAAAQTDERTPMPERCARLARRVARWVRLGQKPVAERKVAFILHNDPCASVEASVGGGAHLDTLESVARVLRSMRERGYAVDVPADGKELIATIMERKAISEFRWTTVDEIVKKGGALCELPVEEYRRWWDTFPASVRERMAATWGNPPGEEVNGVPPAMVHEGRILITGVRYGNATVSIQPKRGCAGPRCDGVVCKILHDPDVPPPHQYLATYRWLSDGFGADVIVHVGTHGNVEFLPGKSVGLSGACLPDLAIHETPHLYIYNSDNPPEGTIAKRRGLAVLVDHMQTVLVEGGLYGDLEELDRLLGEWERARVADKARAHALEHLITGAIERANLDQEMKRAKGPGNPNEAPEAAPFEDTARAAHEALARIRGTRIQDGMHILGDLPQGRRRAEFLHSILRFDAGDEGSLRKRVCRIMGLELTELLNDPGAVHPVWRASFGELLSEVEAVCVEATARTLARHGRTAADAGPEAGREASGSGEDGGGLPEASPETGLAVFLSGLLGDKAVRPARDEDFAGNVARILDLDARVTASREIEALLNGFTAGHIPAGPSGCLTRGRDDILPTGRNFYSLDPRRVPTKAACLVGARLAQALIDKHVEEEGRMPRNVAVFWMCSDIMWSDGEGLGQIMALMGVRPCWLPGGRVQGFEVIPLPELGRPRIDVTVRVSGITRDNFPGSVEYLDQVVQAVASLDEPEDMNFVRAHSLARLREAQAEALSGGATGDGSSEETEEALWRRSTLRIFASRPGTYQPGVNLAVYASAWKEEKDLADIFIHWNGYAYGQGVFGEKAHAELASSVRTVDVTFNKVMSDEHDLFGCCAYFGTHGGMTAAARHLGGKEVRTYYGDTREPERVEVRDLADEIRRVVRTKLLNPKWIEGMKRHGYKGAGDISKRVGRVYGWEASTREVDDWIFDDIARTFVLDEENREFFKENNPWALEEIGRRLLEAQGRGLWQADPEVLEGLKESYLEMEGWLEETMGQVDGQFQGGAVDIVTVSDVAAWKEAMEQDKKR
jgi:cobaltochelatase CobN